MTDSDILLRGGLVISISILIGIAGGYLGQSMMSVSDDILQESASDLREALSGLLLSDAGSKITVSFGDDDFSEKSSIRLPGRIGMRPYRIFILSGLVYLELDGKKITVIKDQRLLPMAPPLNNESISFDMAPSIIFKDGYAMETPCTIIFENYHLTDGARMFIHPSAVLKQIMPEKLNDLFGLYNEVFIPGPDHGGIVEFHHDDGMKLFAEGIVLWKGDEDILNEGSCPRPFILPPSINIPLKTNETLDEFTIVRESVQTADQIYHDTWNVYF
jgi:hypothetical protein